MSSGADKQPDAFSTRIARSEYDVVQMYAEFSEECE